MTSPLVLLIEDYRDLRGEFDKIVSIEMFEAVGYEHCDDYFAACDRLVSDSLCPFRGSAISVNAVIAEIIIKETIRAPTRPQIHVLRSKQDRGECDPDGRGREARYRRESAIACS